MALFFNRNITKEKQQQTAAADKENRRILIVDDDLVGCELMQFSLEHEGFSVNIYHSCEEAIANDLSVYCLYIINVASEDIKGMDLAQYLKQRRTTARIPLIFCSTVEGEDSIIKGLDFGADDYLLKPFSMRELSARVNALLRRQRMSTPAKSDVVVHHGLRLDTVKKTLSIRNEIVPVSGDEYDLLEFLVINRNNIFDADIIFDNVWPDSDNIDSAMIDSLIENLRSKLGPNSIYLVNRSGYGYGYVE